MSRALRSMQCFALALAVGCGSNQAPAEAPPEEPGAEAAETTVSRMPRCGAAETPELTSYLEVRAGDGVARHVEVVRDPRNGVWMPASNIDMPMHHATAIRWTNMADLSLVPESSEERLRFAFTLLSRDIRQVAERQWRTEYMAEVSTVCAITDDTARAIGVHVPDVHGPDEAACAQFETQVETAVQNAAQCTDDDQCVIREVSACDMRGVGCYWVAVSRDADMAPIEAAIRAHDGSGCPTSDCDCPTPPTTAQCVDGSCTEL